MSENSRPGQPDPDDRAVPAGGTETDPETTAGVPGRLHFRHETVDATPPSGRLFTCEPVDLTGNGRPDVVVGGMGATDISLPLPGVTVARNSRIGYFSKRLETDLFWYENPGWERHAMTDETDLRLLGGTFADLDGSGEADFLVGQGFARSDIYRFERPAEPRETWAKHLVRSDYEKYHDLAVGDVDGDGRPELVGLSQGSETLFYYDVPRDPTREPWPDGTHHVIDSGVDLEGLAVVDLDGDGTNELVAGTYVYEYASGNWEREAIATGWDWTRVAVADLDGDGDLEVVLAEGDSPHMGSHPGRVAWFDPPDWDLHVLRDDMFCPHSLQVADFDGNGHPDVYVAEMGLGKHDDPEGVVFRNAGGADFDEQVVHRGVATHEARAVDLTGDGRPDIVGKSFEPASHVDVWYNTA
jgi:hypothetical protein